MYGCGIENESLQTLADAVHRQVVCGIVLLLDMPLKRIVQDLQEARKNVKKDDKAFRIDE